MRLQEIIESLTEIHRRIVEAVNEGPFSPEGRFNLSAEAIALRQRITALEGSLEFGDDRRHFICLCPDCVKPREAFHLTDDASVAVADDVFYLPMSSCPVGANVLLLNIGGVACLGSIRANERAAWQGWFPLPRRRK